MKNKHLLTEIENINRLIGYDRSKPVLEQSENLSQKVKRIMPTFGKCTDGLPYNVTQGVKTDDNDTQIINKISKNINEGISFLLYQKSNWGSDNRYIDRSVGEKPFKELIKDFERGYNITIPYNRKAANQEPWSPPKNTPKLPDGSPNYYVFLMRYLGSTDICEFFETYKKIPEETKSNRILKSIINLSDTDKKELAGILSWLAIPAAVIPGVGPILSAVISLSAAGLYMSAGESGTAAMETFFAVVPFLKVGKLLGPVIKGIPPQQVGKFFNMLAKGEKYSKIVEEVGEDNAKKIINKLVKDGDEIIEEMSKSMSTKTFNNFKNLVGKSYEDAILEMPSLKDIGKEGYEKLMELVAYSNVNTLDGFKLMINNAKKIVLGVTKFTVLIGTGFGVKEIFDRKKLIDTINKTQNYVDSKYENKDVNYSGLDVFNKYVLNPGLETGMLSIAWSDRNKVPPKTLYYDPTNYDSYSVNPTDGFVEITPNPNGGWRPELNDIHPLENLFNNQERSELDDLFDMYIKSTQD